MSVVVTVVVLLLSVVFLYNLRLEVVVSVVVAVVVLLLSVVFLTTHDEYNIAREN